MWKHYVCETAVYEFGDWQRVDCVGGYEYSGDHGDLGVVLLGG